MLIDLTSTEVVGCSESKRIKVQNFTWLLQKRLAFFSCFRFLKCHWKQTSQDTMWNSSCYFSLFLHCDLKFSYAKISCWCECCCCTLKPQSCITWTRCDSLPVPSLLQGSEQYPSVGIRIQHTFCDASIKICFLAKPKFQSFPIFLTNGWPIDVVSSSHLLVNPQMYLLNGPLLLFPLCHSANIYHTLFSSI